MDIITIKKNDPLFPEIFKAIGSVCPEHIGTMHTVRFAKKYGKPIKSVFFKGKNDMNSGNSYIVDQRIGEYIEI